MRTSLHLDTVDSIMQFPFSTTDYIEVIFPFYNTTHLALKNEVQLKKLSCILVLSLNADRGSTVKIRIEGKSNTIFESNFHFTRGHNITVESGDSAHHCDGKNLNSHPTAGSTVTSALDDASKCGRFTWDGTFSTIYDDFFITRIGSDAQTATQFWGILANYNYTKTGGCETRVQQNDEVLFAFDAFSKKYFLKLTVPLTARRGCNAIFRVTDGATDAPISGAKVGKYVSDSNGNVKVAFTSGGRHKLKAEHKDYIRSNAIYVRVQ
ncbi:unnamed protein product [Rotaria socialis]|uniref:Uncharacterized protein n=1 Tax=Rotaria socialis TaxID=392032 RepID=A0A820JJ94_9BILA|nr:unnamed protein product [Rotaria socialis]CAF4327877.1 unnamed protein product [Rotaria socialis]